jgi:hypothetical protein
VLATRVVEALPRLPRQVEAAAVDGYVADAVARALGAGVVVRSGSARLSSGGEVIVEDEVVVHVLERDERDRLVAVWCSLVERSTPGLAAALARFGASVPPGALEAAAERAVVSLGCRWSGVALGIALHVATGPLRDVESLARPLLALTAELLQRLDLAHLHRVEPGCLADPDAAGWLAAVGY